LSQEKLGPVCEIVDSEDAAEYRNLDYGVRLNYILYNAGAQGSVIVRTGLYTSEGDFTQNRRVNLSAKESRKVSFLFTQPTINATDMSYRATCEAE
jgi:hypothetical protein